MSPWGRSTKAFHLLMRGAGRRRPRGVLLTVQRNTQRAGRSLKAPFLPLHGRRPGSSTSPLYEPSRSLVSLPHRPAYGFISCGLVG